MYAHGRGRGFVRGRYKQLRYVNARDGDEDKENFIIKTMRFGVKQDETDFERSAKRTRTTSRMERTERTPSDFDATDKPNNSDRIVES